MKRNEKCPLELAVSSGGFSKSTIGKVQRIEVRIQSTEKLTGNWNTEIARKGPKRFH